MKKTSRVWLKAVAVTCAVLILSSAIVYAASPAVRNYINMLFLYEDSVARLDYVPEGYIGVYTAENLHDMRKNMTGKYILMNDIEITPDYYEAGGLFEGGFVPIGAVNDMFNGIFNGNGHDISGLVIDGNYSAAGLFGYCGRLYKDASDGTMPSISGGIIKNLGLVNSSVTLDLTKAPRQLIGDDAREVYPESAGGNRYVGSIAGFSDYLVGCYTENVSVSVVSDETVTSLAVGGAVGGANFVDSCYGGSVVTASGTVAEGAEVNVGGVAGYAYSCVTSYFDGSIDSAWGDGGVTCVRDYDVPMVLNEALMTEIVSRLSDVYEMTGNAESAPDNDAQRYESDVFKAYYSKKEYMSIDLPYQDYLTAPTDTVAIYLLDPMTKPREYKRLSSFIEKAFPDGSFREYCRENLLKSGYYYCYDLRYDTDCTFDGFDFGGIWNNPDKPTLRLFDSTGSYKVVAAETEADETAVAETVG